MTAEEIQNILEASSQVAYLVEQRKRLLDTDEATIASLNEVEKELAQAAGGLQAALDGIASEKHWKQLQDGWRELLATQIGVVKAVCSASPFTDLQDAFEAGRVGPIAGGGDDSEKDLDDIRAEDLQQDGGEDPFESFEGEER